MEVTTEKTDLKNLDKSDWQTFRFDKIAQKISERVDPNETDLDTYIGLTHIDGEDIHIRRNGTSDDVKGTKLRFYPGDVIFGRRRAYQRKAAIANMHGFCSAHALVLRANPEVIDPNLFPFFLHSDQFMHRAVDISVGSLSPTINWGKLKVQEFQIPPKEKQAQLAELLWSLDDVIEKKKNAKDRYETLYRKYLFDEVSGKSSKKSETWQEHKLNDISTSFSGLSGKSKKDFGTGKPFVTYMNVFSNSKVNPKQYDLVEVEEGESQTQLQYGDILLTGSSETPEEVGMSSVVLDNIEGYYLNSFCYGYRLNNFEVLLPEFARFLFRGQEVRNFMFKHAQGSTRFNLSKSTVKKKLVLRLPSISEQKRIAENLESMVKIVKKFGKTVENSKRFQRSLINQIF